jgi:hypothetical protein
MPLELVPVDVDEEFVVVAAPNGLEDCTGGFAADVDELEELEPHAATPSAANSSRTAAKRRGDLFIVAFMDCSCSVAIVTRHSRTACGRALD